MATFSTRGRLPGLMAANTWIPHQASSRPSAAPPIASTALSVSIWRMMRRLLPPSVARTAISRPRAEARTSNRFATLLHAISSTNPTALSRASSTGRAWSTTSLCMEFTTMCMLLLACAWYISLRRPAKASISCCARSGVTPSFSRATTVSHAASRDTSVKLLGTTRHTSMLVGIPASSGR